MNYPAALYTKTRFQGKVEKSMPLIFSDLIREDLENKRPYSARFDTKCSKCDGKIVKYQDIYFYGKGKRICAGCHEEAIDWMKTVIF